GVTFAPAIARIVAFGWSTLRFRQVRRGRVIVRYGQGVQAHLDPAAILDSCEQILNEMAERLGRSLRLPLVVYLFPTLSELARLLKQEMGGAALVGGEAIVLGADHLALSVECEETLRHEVAHLFSIQQGELGP